MMPIALALVVAAPLAGELSVGHERLRRGLRFDDHGGCTTTHFAGARDRFLVTGEEFRFELADGRAIAPRDLPQATLLALPAELGKRGLAIRFTSAESAFIATVAYVADEDEPWLRKQVRLATRDAKEAAAPLARIDVERLTLQGGLFTGGGVGGVATGSGGFFAAIADPAAEARVDGATVVLSEWPATSALPAGELHEWPWSQPALVGLDRSGDAAARWLAGFAKRCPSEVAKATTLEGLAAAGDALLFPLLGDPAAPDLRATRKALVAALQHEGKLRAPRWLAFDLLACGELDAATRSRHVATWSALFETARKLCPTTKLALRGGGRAPLSPFWGRFVDHLGDPVAVVPLDGDDDWVAARLATRHGWAAPLLVLPDPAATGAVAERRRWAEQAIAYWNGAATGEEAPQARVNDGWQPTTVELPPRAGGWLRLAPWCEWLGGDEQSVARCELAPREAGLFVPLFASGASGPLPDRGRFELRDAQQPPALLLAPGTTQSFEWLDASDGKRAGGGRVGAAPAWQRREAGAPFVARLAPPTADERGVKLEVAFATPRYREEEVELHVAVEGASLDLSLTDAKPDGVATIARGLGGEWRIALRETREPPAVSLRLDGPLAGATRLVVVARLHERLVAVPLAPPTRTLSPRLRPATPTAARRTTTLLLHDGPLPAAPSVNVETRAAGQ